MIEVEIFVFSARFPILGMAVEHRLAASPCSRTGFSFAKIQRFAY
jgi:hypothetical protein